MSHEGRVSGARLNRTVERTVERYYALRDYYVELLMEDGYPPFTAPLGPEEQYRRLVEWKLTGDPRFTRSVAAQDALAALERVLGPAPAVMPPVGM